MIKKLIKNAFEKIFIIPLRPLMRKIVGWDKQEEAIDTLLYVINNSIDITSFPKATGNLRKTQLADAEALRIFHEICIRNSLEYWLDWGTLLGAVRHKGFIPWDDDLDVSMTREMYEKARRILPGEVEKYGFKFIDGGDKSLAIMNWKAGVTLDIFPMDNVSASAYEKEEVLLDRMVEYRKYYVKKAKSASREKMMERKRELIGEYVTENPLWYHNPEFSNYRFTHTNESVFPLRTVEFEGYSFYAPNDYDNYLTKLYGNYMSFPKGGVLHHAAGGRGIYNNCDKFDVNMDEYLKFLRSIEVHNG